MKNYYKFLLYSKNNFLVNSILCYINVDIENRIKLILNKHKSPIKNYFVKCFYGYLMIEIKDDYAEKWARTFFDRSQQVVLLDVQHIIIQLSLTILK
jgi:hypothetical protein